MSEQCVVCYEFANGQLMMLGGRLSGLYSTQKITQTTVLQAPNLDHHGEMVTVQLIGPMQK